MSHRIRSQIIPRNASVIFANEQEYSTEEEKVKQAYFKEHILIPYSEREDVCDLFVDQFFQFLEKEKGIQEPANVDLKVISLEELKMLIGNFKKKNGLDPKQVEPLPIMPEEMAPSLSNRKSVSIIFDEFFDIVPEKVQYKNGAWDYELKINSLQCKRKQYFYNHLIRTSVVVKNPIVRKKATYFFFQTKTLWIKISSNYRNSIREVSRTIDDFIFLRDTLEKIYPHSFLPELNITMEEIKNIDSQLNNIQISKKCGSFLNFVMEEDELFDNVFTFEFLTQESEAKYAQHKAKNESICVNTIQQFVNSTGTLKANVSKEGQQTVRSIIAISQLFKEKFAQISNVTKDISQHIQRLPKLIEDFMALVDQIIAVANSHKDNSFFSLVNFINLLLSYKKIGQITRESLHCCEPALSNIRQSFLLKTITSWSQFNTYRQNMMQFSSIYQQKRKNFLQKISVDQNQPIDKLDLTSNQQECSWIEKETSWYGHLNFSLIKTFSIFLKKEQEALHRALKEALAVLNERHERQKNNLDFISRLISSQ